MLKTELNIVTEIYCRKDQLTSLATPETLLSETPLFDGNETFVSWTISARISLARVGEISRPNTQGIKKANLFSKR